MEVAIQPNGFEETRFPLLMHKWSRYIRVMAHRFQVEGADEEELYNDGLLILYECAMKSQFVVETRDWEKMFKTHLGHAFTDHVRSHKAKCRDFRKTDPMFRSVREGSVIGGNEGMHPNVVLQCVLAFGDNFESRDYVEHFVNVLTEEESILLRELVEPSERTVSIFDAKIFQRKPKRIPLKTIAGSLGWSTKKAKYVRRSICRKYVQFTGSYNFEIAKI